MTVITIVTILFAFICCRVLYPQWKQHYRREFWVNAALSVSGYVILVLARLNIEVPSPLDPISDFVRAVFNIR